MLDADDEFEVVEAGADARQVSMSDADAVCLSACLPFYF